MMLFSLFDLYVLFKFCTLYFYALLGAEKAPRTQSSTRFLCKKNSCNCPNSNRCRNYIRIHANCIYWPLDLAWELVKLDWR
jgi:hypothetical protein